MPNRVRPQLVPTGPELRRICRMSLFFVLLALSPFAACTGGFDDPEYEAPIDNRSTLVDVVSPEGTTLALEDVEVRFPPGAVTEETEVTVKLGPTRMPDVPVFRGDLRPIVEVSPFDLDLQAEMVIAAPESNHLTAELIARHEATPEKRILAAYRLDAPDADALTHVDATFSLNLVEYKTTHGGVFVATEKRDFCMDDVTPPVCPDGFVDKQCDIVPGECPDGETISVDVNGCTACAPTAAHAESCEATEGELFTFMDRVISRSCANACDVDSDCVAYRFESACGDGCYSLYGGIDEEPIQAFLTFAEQRCGVCGSEVPTIVEVGQGVCDGRHQCLFTDGL